MKSVEVRSELVDALQLDLVGPMQTAPDVWRGNPEERLDQPPSRWYLTGFIVPIDAEASQRAEEVSVDEIDAAGDIGGIDDDASPDPP